MTFSEWLFAQHDRSDDIGRLARLAKDDEGWPDRAGTLIGYFITHVGGFHYYDSCNPEWQYEAMYAALEEYERLENESKCSA